MKKGLYYIANSRLPTIKAYGLQIVKMCEAFTRAGFEVELVIPKRNRYPNTGDGGILEYYNIKTPFKVRELSSPDLIDINLGPFLNRVLFWFQQIIFARSLRKYLADKEGIVYSRDQFSASIVSGKNLEIYWEAHNFPQRINSGFYKKVLKNINGLVVISQGLKNDFEKYYYGSILVARDGVDLEEFDVHVSNDEAKKILNLPLSKKIIMYAGHLYKWKGVDLILESAKLFEDGGLFVFVGGTEIDVNNFKTKAESIGCKNVLILGHKSYREIPLYLKSADCLILTGSKSEYISEKYTSPLRLFEYMASGRPIVAQKLPSFLEVLNDGNSILVEPENTQALAEGINKIFTDKDLAKRVSDQALKDIREYAWQNRAEKIISGLLWKK